jgi:hypothetical protein
MMGNQGHFDFEEGVIRKGYEAKSNEDHLSHGQLLGVSD